MRTSITDGAAASGDADADLAAAGTDVGDAGTVPRPVYTAPVSASRETMALCLLPIKMVPSELRYGEEDVASSWIECDSFWISLCAPPDTKSEP